MLLRDLRLADPQATATGTVDQLPRPMALGIDEGRPAGTAARLRLSAGSIDLGDTPRDHELVARRGAQPGRCEDPVGRCSAVAVAEAEIRGGDMMNNATAIDGLRRYQDMREFPAIGTAIHGDRAADRARDTAQEFQSGQAVIARGGGYENTRCAAAASLCRICAGRRHGRRLSAAEIGSPRWCSATNREKVP